jgi:hypothetical protein
MKNVKSTKTLMSFAGSSMNLSEMKKVQGGGASGPRGMCYYGGYLAPCQLH